MIYDYTGGSEYKVKFYLDIGSGRSPVLDYIEQLGLKEKMKILKYVEFLREHRGVLDEPYTKHKPCSSISSPQADEVFGEQDLF